MTLLSSEGLNLTSFEPVLAAALGNTAENAGDKILAEAVVRDRSQVQLQDWLYCLANSSATWVRRRLVDAFGQPVETFINSIEGGLDSPANGNGMPPMKLTSDAVSADVLTMLERAEKLQQTNAKSRLNDVYLTWALFNTAGSELLDMLELWAGERWKTAREELDGLIVDITRPELFNAEGKLDSQLFTAGGKNFCARLRADARALSAKQVTTRHLLYSLLAFDGSLLSMALALRGVDPMKNVHSQLTRELVRPGRKSLSDLSLSRDSITGPVQDVLQEAYVLARRRGAPGIAVCDLERAVLSRQAGEFARLLKGFEKIDFAGLKDFVDNADPGEEEEESPILKFSMTEVEQAMKQRVCGQEYAIERVLPWIKRLRFGLPRDGRPAAVFLFLGPTGAGKTQLAKELAKFVFGDPDQMIFLEMGQFKTKESMSAFIGAPPGYIGYGDGKLTNGLADKPECVVLFDEIEKACVEVFDVLLRFADEGLISDPAGPVRDGRKCVIVMTTNAGQRAMREQAESDEHFLESRDALPQWLFEAAREELDKAGFRPEFLGRVDECISFLPFTLETCRKIVDLNLNAEISKFHELKGVRLDVGDDIRDDLAKQAKEKCLNEGARGAPRAVNNHVVTPAIDLLSSYENRTLPRRLEFNRDDMGTIMIRACDS